MLRSCSVNHRRLIIVVSGVGVRCNGGDLRWRLKFLRRCLSAKSDLCSSRAMCMKIRVIAVIR